MTVHTVEQKNKPTKFYEYIPFDTEAAAAQLVEALRYIPAGHGFDSRCSQWISIILSVALWSWGRLSL
jgi:hypothetical protein